MNLVKIINTLLIIDIGIVLFTYLSGNRVWFINTQIGYISSALVVFATFLSYRKMVQKRVALGAVDNLDRDTIDKIEDPYSLYDEDRADKVEEIDLKEQKEELKKQKLSTLEALKNSRATLSIYRLGAYLILIFGFFYLNKTHQLDIIPYIFAISLPPVIIVIFLIRLNRE
jgi:hypothetical protein